MSNYGEAPTGLVGGQWAVGRLSGCGPNVCEKMKNAGLHLIASLRPEKLPVKIKGVPARDAVFAP
jgi:hypothetical protein